MCKNEKKQQLNSQNRSNCELKKLKWDTVGRSFVFWVWHWYQTQHILIGFKIQTLIKIELLDPNLGFLGLCVRTSGLCLMCIVQTTKGNQSICSGHFYFWKCMEMNPPVADWWEHPWKPSENGFGRFWMQSLIWRLWL